MKCYFCQINIESVNNSADLIFCNNHSVQVSTYYYRGQPEYVSFHSKNNKFLVDLDLELNITTIYANNYEVDKVLELQGYPITPDNVDQKLPLYILLS